jgi:Secretion system C-terminal sorting domain
MRKLLFFIAIVAMSFLNLITKAQTIPFTSVVVEQTIGTGNNQLLLILDFDSDTIGTDSSFAWIINYSCDSLTGDSILKRIDQENINFTVDITSNFLNNISYLKNTVTYTNPHIGWFSILESEDGENWQWNTGGINDSVGNTDWIGIVVMDTATFQSDINIPLHISSICAAQNANKLHVYPNPATDYITIEQAGILRIFSMNGKETWNYEVQTGNFNISFLSKGIYQLMLINEEKISTTKLIIQ